MFWHRIGPPIVHRSGSDKSILRRKVAKDPNPTWMGYSAGRWDGNVLVVDSAGFNGNIWLDTPGHPATDALHITERFERRDYGHLDI